MEAHLSFLIPIRGLKPGIHQYSFQIDHSFFEGFESSLIQHGKVSVEVSLDKRPDLYVLEFDFDGWVGATCDRCLAPIQLPIAGQNRLLIKFSLEESRDEGEVVYITPETPKLNIANFIYEFVCLNLPMVKIYDCEEEEQPPCDEEMLKHLEDDQDDQQRGDPIWDALKDLKK